MSKRTFLWPAIGLSWLVLSCQPDFPPKKNNTGQTEQPAGKEAVPQPVATFAQQKTTHGDEIGKRRAAEMVAAGFKRYSVEKGTLLFRIDGAIKGMDALYFDHWGWREGKYNLSDADVGAYQQKDRNIQFLDGERRYEYLPEADTAYWFDSDQVQRMADQYDTKDMAVVGDEMIKNMGGKKVGQTEVMGVTCDVWQIEKIKTTLYMWRGITLKEVSFAGDLPITRRCVQLDTASAVSLEKMTLPNGVVKVAIN